MDSRSPNPPSHIRDRPTLRVAVWGAVAIGLLLRLSASFQSFWLDEIWSYFLAQELDSVWQVFTERRHDNNHILNTLFIRAMGEHEHGFPYRVLSLVTGTASIYWLARIARERGAEDAIAAAVLVAASFPMTVASAQARGYAAAMFFSLIAVDWIRRSSIRPGWGSAVGFWVVCVLGLLSHLTFLYAYLSILLWTVLASGSRTPGADDRSWSDLARLHAGPVIAIALLYLVFYREIVIGGGPSDYQVWTVAGRTVAEAVGLRGNGAWLALGWLIAAVFISMGLHQAWRLGLPRFAFFVSVLLLAPALLYLVSSPRLLYPRYFWACVPFFYLLVAHALGWMYRSSKPGRMIYCVLLGVFVLFHAQRIADYSSVGRTHYADALGYLEQNTDADLIHIGTDHDFRNTLVLRFYARYRDAGKSFVVREKQTWTGPGPQWYLAHSWLAGPFPPRHLTFGGGRSYTMVERFDNGIASGWSWYLYRNDAH